MSGVGAGGRRGPASFGGFDPGGGIHSNRPLPGDFVHPMPAYPDYGPPPVLPNDGSGGSEASGVAGAAAAAGAAAGGGVKRAAGKAAERSEGGSGVPPDAWGLTTPVTPWGWSDWADASGWADGPSGGFPGAGLFAGAMIGAERTIGSDQDMIEDLLGELGDSPEDVAEAKREHRANRGTAKHRLKTLKAAAEHTANTVIEASKFSIMLSTAWAEEALIAGAARSVVSGGATASRIPRQFIRGMLEQRKFIKSLGAGVDIAAHFKTPYGWRYMDGLKRKTAYEVKSGFVGMTETIRQQVAKDVWIRENHPDRVRRVVWVFRENYSGKGMADEVRELLRRNGIIIRE